MSLNPCLVSSGRYSAGCTVQGTAGVVYQLLHSVNCTSHQQAGTGYRVVVSHHTPEFHPAPAWTLDTASV